MFVLHTQQLSSGIRRGLGLLGAGKKYVVITPSMTKSSDLAIISEVRQSVLDTRYDKHDDDDDDV